MVVLQIPLLLDHSSYIIYVKFNYAWDTALTGYISLPVYYRNTPCALQYS